MASRLLKQNSKKTLPTKVSQLQLYLNERQFEIRINSKTSNRGNFIPGMPQGPSLDPLLYVLYTSDIQIPTKNDTVIFSTYPGFSLSIFSRTSRLKINRNTTFIGL